MENGFQQDGNQMNPFFLEGLETIWQSFGPDLNFSGKAKIVYDMESSEESSD